MEWRRRFRSRLDWSSFTHTPAARMDHQGLTTAVLTSTGTSTHVDSLSSQSPLPALAVYIDVNLSATLQMLRTAVTVALQEAATCALVGMQARFKQTCLLQRRVERLWLLPWELHLGKSSDRTSLPPGGLPHRHQCHEAAQRPSTTASGSSVFPSFSLRSDESWGWRTEQEDRKSSPLSQDEAAKLVSNETAASDPLASESLYLLEHNDTAVASPLELLAAYAGDISPMLPSVVPQRPSDPSTKRETTATAMHTFSASGCVVGLCVRSLFDLYIQAIRSLQSALLPEGSVVLVAAVNIPMMFRVLEEHHLIVQPLDLNPQTLMPTKDSLKRDVLCWGPLIKALLCSHLYGDICDMEPLVTFCTKHRLLLIKDCAESFVGELYRGHPRADLSLFSFGLIKTCTAAGGGIATVCSRLVAARMQSLQGLYPFSSRRTFLKRLCVTIGACGLQSKFIMKSLLRLCNVSGWNLGTFLQSFVRHLTGQGIIPLYISCLPAHAANLTQEVAQYSLVALGPNVPQLWRVPQVRGFPSKGELFKLLRVQPNASLLAVLLKRLETWNLTEFVEDQSRTLGFARRVQQLGLLIPGGDAAFKTFWLFPVLTPAHCSTVEFVSALRENGLYAARDFHPCLL